MKRLPIESLLRWAFRDELPKGKPVAASAWSIVENYAATGGVRIDSGSPGGGDGLGFVYGDPHPDAEIVAQAVAQLAPSVILGDDRMIDLLGEFTARDETGRYSIIDAHDVRAVALAPFSPRAMIIRCATLGKPMVWDLGAPTLKPMMIQGAMFERKAVFGFDHRGELMLLDPDQHGRYKIKAQPRTMLRWVDPSMRMLAETRAEFAVWHDALLALVHMINKRGLAEHVALPPMMPAMPWRDGAPPAPPAPLKSAVRVLTTALPLQPKRKAALRPVESAIERQAREARAKASADRRRAKKPAPLAEPEGRLHPFSAGN